MIESLKDYVFVIDISPSMGKSYQDCKPSKLQAVKEILAYNVSRVLDEIRGLRTALVVFYGLAFPVLMPTEDLKLFLKSISLLEIGGPGSAPGNGLIEAVKVVRRSKREKEVVLITDGGFNEGIRLDHAAIYAKNANVKVHIIALGEISKNDEDVILATARLTGGEMYSVKSRKELVQGLNNLLKKT